jgi:hypothetical protein
LYDTAVISVAIEFISQGNPTTLAVNSGFGVKVGYGVLVGVIVGVDVFVGWRVLVGFGRVVGVGADNGLHEARNRIMTE